MGIDAVYCDRPERMVEVLEEGVNSPSGRELQASGGGATEV